MVRMEVTIMISAFLNDGLFLKLMEGTTKREINILQTSNAIELLETKVMKLST